jgi:hypothetical protein
MIDDGPLYEVEDFSRGHMQRLICEVFARKWHLELGIKAEPKT